MRRILPILTCLMIIAGSITASTPVQAAPDLSSGDMVSVINTLDVGLAVRDAPAGDTITRKYDGTRGSVIGGPTVATLPSDGRTYTWWEIRWGDDGTEGWSADSFPEPGGSDYLRKATKPVSTKFSVGQRVQVVNMDGYNYRTRLSPPGLLLQDESRFRREGDTGTIYGLGGGSNTYYGVPSMSGGAPVGKGPDGDYFYHFWRIQWDDGWVTWSAEGGIGGDYLVAISDPPIVGYIHLTPQSSSILVGESQSYTVEAFDQYGNSIGDVTSSATIWSLPSGCRRYGNTVYATSPGTYNVYAHYAGKYDTATLNVAVRDLPYIQGWAIDRDHDGFYEKGLPSCSVSVDGVLVTATDENGHFFIPGLSPKLYQVRVQPPPGYYPYEEEYTVREVEAGTGWTHFWYFKIQTFSTFEFHAVGDQELDVPFPVTIWVRDPYGNLDSSYSGQAVLSVFAVFFDEYPPDYWEPQLEVLGSCRPEDPDYWNVIEFTNGVWSGWVQLFYPDPDYSPDPSARLRLWADNPWGDDPFGQSNLFALISEEPPPEGVGHVTLIDPLSLTHGPYTVGQTLTATFRIKNAGNAAITLDKLLLGGRYEGGELPWGGYPDFTYEAVTLAPEQTHLYQGTFTIPAPGDYHFFIAYYIEDPTEAEKQYLDEHNWNTHIDLGPGLTDADRTRQISASSLYTHTIAYIPVTYKDFGAPTHTVQELKQRAAMVVDYYEQQSYGKVQIDFEFIFNEWEELGKTLEEYNNLEFPEDEAAVAFDALQLAGVNTNEYDAIIVVEPYGEHESAAWDEPYNMVLTTDRRTYATWAHELGHVIFKWDEYYGEYSEDFTIGRGDIEYWGLMGRATLMNPTAPIMSYNKVLAGWLDYDTILPDQYGTYPVKLLMELQRDDQVHRYQTKADATTKYYIFEGRHPPDGIQTDPWDDYTWGDYEYRLDEEKGVLLYRVYLKQGIEHVSAIPHVGALTWSDDTTNRVTLTPGDTYPDDLAGVTFTAHENDSELSIEISGYTPLSRTIISLSELSWEVSGTSVLSEPFPSENRLDIDLHMYAYDGQKVGMDYATGEYLVQIEDARTSGNTPGGGPEWISIPQGTKIYFTIDPTPARKWGEERGLSITEIEAEIKAVFFDAEGERTETEPTKIPVDPDKPAKLIIEDGEIRLLASVDFDPNTLNLRGRGRGVVTVYIELPEGFDVNNIDISSILLNGTVPALSQPTAIGDYNDNGVPDLMVKFDRRAVQAILEVGQSVEITITGEVDGIPFMGVDTIRVLG